MCLPVAVAGFVSCSALSAHAYTHPCIPSTRADLDYVKARLNQQPWKNCYEGFTNISTARLDWVMPGPFENVSRKGAYDGNLKSWQDSMNAVYNLSLMWYFTGNSAYAQKGRDILIAWANTHTNFSGNESGLALGDHALAFGGGASILRGTWSGWTAADTTTVQNYFRNVLLPASLAGGNILGPANKGAIYSEAGIAIAVFCDDTAKFNQIVNMMRTFHGSGLTDTLPTGQLGETGRDAGHAWGQLNGLIFTAEVAWKQGVDLYGEMNNRLLACGEYFARNAFTTDNPYVPFGTIDWQWMGNVPALTTPGGGGFFMLKNAYTNRKGLPTPWIDRKLQEQPIDFMFYKTSDSGTATLSPATFPGVSLASSGLTLTTLGSQTSGRSLSYANGTWTLSGLGNTVWSDTADDCQFAYKQMSGDCAMVVRVASFTHSGNNEAKCGVMIRDNTSATVSQRGWAGIKWWGSSNTNMMESHMRGWTENWGGGGYDDRSHTWPSPVPAIPYWIKIERLGKQITTFVSGDGTSWSPLNCTYYGNLPSTLYIGLFVCSGNTTAQTATFDHVAFTGGSGGLVTTPAAPAGLIAAAAPTANFAVTTRWLPSFGATSYDLLRSTSAGSGYAVLASNLTGTSYVDTSVIVGVNYYYRVRAKNSAGTSGDSMTFGGSHSLLIKPMTYIATGGTANDSANNPANAASAFDQNCGSQWFYSGTTGWLQYDLGAGNAKVVNRYTVTEAITIPARDPKDWQFQGSQDGSTWTTLDSRSGQTFAYTYQQLPYDIGNTTAYRYYRINVTANNGDATFLHIGELGLWSNTGGGLPVAGTYKVQCRTSGIMLDSWGRTTAGSSCAIYLTDSGSANQKWNLTYVGTGVVNLQAVGGGLYLDGGGFTANGSTCKLWGASTSNNLRWTLIDVGGGYYKLKNVATGMCVDVGASPYANGDNCEQWGEGTSYNQQWRFVP